MNELRTHIVSAFCLGIVLIIPACFETNLFWLAGIILLFFVMILRSLLGEISEITETLFIAADIIILALTLLKIVK